MRKLLTDKILLLKPNILLRSYLLIEIQMGKVRSIFLVNEAYFEGKTI